MATMRTFLMRSKFPLLLLTYPVFAWFLLTRASATPSLPNLSSALIVALTRAVYLLVGLSFSFLLIVPVWASRYRTRPKALAEAFRRGLSFTLALLALILPAQGAVLAVALYVADPNEFWIWATCAAGGAILGTVLLLDSGLGEKPRTCVTLRALRIQLKDHPKLATLMRELSEDLQVPLPRHVMLGMQPALFGISETVFCPEGELEGGVVCFSLPSNSVLSIPEFRALAGEALINLHTSLTEGRNQFLSTSEGAHDVVKNLIADMQEWSWLPKWGLHPLLVALRLVVVAAIRFPMYLGKECVTFYVEEFWASRWHADMGNVVAVHQTSAAEVGAVLAISALIKEAALSLGVSFPLFSEGKALHALGKIVLQIREQHPRLQVEDNVASPWHDPVSAWQYLQFRCRLSGISLEWCRQQALGVTPNPPAKSLFEDAMKLDAQLVEIIQSPFVLTRQTPPFRSAQ